MNTVISFNVNNRGRLTLSQEAHDGPVTISASSPYGYETIIPAGDMVQLINLYRYTQRYDIADSFINPGGRRILSGGELKADPRKAAADDQEGSPLTIWYFLCRDENGGYHIYRRPVNEQSPDPSSREEINEIIEALNQNFYFAHGGALLASWAENQLVEVADLADIPLEGRPGSRPRSD